MNRLIIFDFNRTIFDPEAGELVPGARELLQVATERGYRLVLLAKAAESRRELIEQLGLTHYFAEIILAERKAEVQFRAIASRHQAKLSASFVVGDRAQGEVYLGRRTGWRTIWLRSGRFAGELPHPGFEPEFTVTHLPDVAALI